MPAQHIKEQALKKFYSVKEASKTIGVSTNTIYKYLDDGSLKGKRLGGRGRFKIPYAELAPYFAQETSAVEKLESATPEATIADIPSKDQSSLIGSWAEIASIGAGVLVILWGVGSIMVSARPTILKAVGGEVLSYSGRTFSGFGRLVAQITPSQNASSQEVAGIAVSPSPTGTPKVETQDVNSKLKNAEREAYELYVNAQTLASTSQKLLGSSRTITTSELNDTVLGMAELLGPSSDEDKSTTTDEVTLLAAEWNFPGLTPIKMTSSRISSILDSLAVGSVVAFSKTDVKNLDDLTVQAELLQRLVGNITDTPNDKTVFGNIRKVETLVKTLDAQNAEVGKILERWNLYDLSEKEDRVNTTLSNTLSINLLPGTSEILPASASAEMGDTELKNILLATGGVLTANKTHLSQNASDPVEISWTLADGTQKTFSVTPGKVQNIANVVVRAPVIPLVGIEKIPEATPTVVLGAQTESTATPIAIATLSPTSTPLSTTTPKPVASAQPTPSLAPEPVNTITPAPAVAAVEIVTPPPSPGFVPVTGEVAGVATVNPDTQRSIGVGVSTVSTALLAYYLLLLFVRREKKPKIKKTMNFVAKTSKALVWIKNLLIDFVEGIGRFAVAIIMFPVKIVRTLVGTIVTFVKKVWEMVTTFVRNTIKGIVNFVKKIVASIVATTTSVLKFILGIPGAIWGIIVRVATSTKNFFVGIALGIYKFVTSIVESVIAAIRKVILSGVNLISNIARAIKTFIGSIVRGVTNLAVAIKNGIVKILVAIRDFIVGAIRSFQNLVISLIDGISSGFGAIVRGIARFVNEAVNLVAKTAVSIKNALVNTFTAVKNFVARVIKSTVDLIVSIINTIKNATLAAANAVTRFFISTAAATWNLILRIVNSVITLVENIILAASRAVRAVITIVIKAAVAVVKFVLKTVSATLKALASPLWGLYKLLIGITETTDKTLSSIHFEAPEFTHSQIKSRKAAVLILVGLTASISSVFSINVLAGISKTPTTLNLTMTPSPEPTAEPVIEKVTILETGTGWLRVRETPKGEEIAKVHPGESYSVIAKENGWVLIGGEGSKSLPAGGQGWVSGKFVSFN